MKRFLKVTLFVVGCLITLIALAWNLYNWRARRAWETYRREARARGVKLELTELAPPPVPDDQNFAALPMIAALFDKTRSNEAARANAIGLSRPDQDRRAPEWTIRWRSGKPLELIGWAACVAGRSNETTAARDVLNGLASRAPALEEIAAYARRPAARFPVQWDQGVAALLPHLSALRQWSRVFTLRACAELAAGDAPAALEDTVTGLRLATALREEPILISGLVEIAILEQTLQSTWEGLTAHAWSTEELERLGATLADLDLIATAQVDFQGERAMGTGVGLQLLRNRGAQAIVLGDGSAAPGLVRLVPAGVWYRGLVRLNQGYDWLDKMVDVWGRQVSPAAVRLYQDHLESLGTHQGPGLVREPSVMLPRLLLPALDAAAKRFGQAQTAVDHARIACALERYRLAHGDYPADLAALLPQYVAALPHDVIGAGPVRYERVGTDRFRLWSVGWNEADDGGKVVLKPGPHLQVDLDQGDWVWPVRAP